MNIYRLVYVQPGGVANEELFFKTLTGAKRNTEQKLGIKLNWFVLQGDSYANDPEGKRIWIETVKLYE